MKPFGKVTHPTRWLMAVVLLISAWAMAEPADLNLDGKVDERDLLVLLQQWHEGTPFPTATTAATLTPTPTVTPSPTSSDFFHQANDWHYQLHQIDLNQLGSSNYDLLLMDYADDTGTEYPRSQIFLLKSRTSEPKQVFAYIDIGQAENNRFYWQTGWVPGTPQFIDQANPQQAGHYAVWYWTPEWRQLLVDNIDSYLNRILDVHDYDGVVLDNVDEYQYFEAKRETDPSFAAQTEGVDFRAEMVNLISAIHTAAQSALPQFRVIAQGGQELLNQDGFLSNIDAELAQETYLTAAAGRRSATDSAVIETRLSAFKQAGKVVLCLDFASKTALGDIEYAYTHARAQGFVPFVTSPALSEFRINPGYEPD